MSPQVLSWERFEAAAPPVRPAAKPSGGETGRKPKAASAGPAAKAAPKAAAAPAPESLETLLARARGEGRAAGFEEGAAHAEAQGQADLRLILSDIHEQLADVLQSRVELEATMLSSARGLAEALLTGVAPALARRGVAAEIADAVTAALREARARRVEAADAGLQVRVSPGQLDAVRAAFAAAGVAAPVESDADLGDLAARLDWADGEDELDLDAAIEAARAALDRHFPDAQRRAAHG